MEEEWLTLKEYVRSATRVVKLDKRAWGANIGGGATLTEVVVVGMNPMFVAAKIDGGRWNGECDCNFVRFVKSTALMVVVGRSQVVKLISPKGKLFRIEIKK